MKKVTDKDFTLIGLPVVILSRLLMPALSKGKGEKDAIPA